MTNLKPLLDLLKTIDNPDALRATLVAMLISVEEHPFSKEGEFCVQCEPRLRTTEGERE
jgi:hypothetical protein